MNHLSSLELWLPSRPRHKLSFDHVVTCGADCWHWLAAAHMAACLAARVDGMADLMQQAQSSDRPESLDHVRRVRTVLDGGGIAGTEWPPASAGLAATLADHLFLAGLALQIGHGTGINGDSRPGEGCLG